MHAASAPIDGPRLNRFGTRFVDESDEAAFRIWHQAEAQPYARLGLAVSLVSWTVGWFALLIGVEHAGARGAPWMLGVIWPAAIGGLWLVRKPGPAVFWAPALANAVAGVIGVGPVSHYALHEPTAATLLMLIVAFFGFTVFRLPPLLAAAAVAVYAVQNQVQLIVGDLPERTVVVHSIIQWGGFFAGLAVCGLLARVSREAFRRDVVITEQRALIEREQERSEALLRNVLPDTIAERLKESPERIAEQSDEVSVLFADIVGFTPLASSMEPAALVDLLDRVFSSFDALVAKHGIEKIKTIGDAYMAVAGLPVARDDHAEVIARLALDMRAELDRLRRRTAQDISCRIGLATGPAVAGVIGRSKFAYDLWGHTVNMAARMESHGEPGEIQVTEAMHDRLVDTFEMRPRGRVNVKGAGTVSTWFLDGPKRRGRRPRR